MFNINRFVLQCVEILQECGDCTRRVSDCEELVGLLIGDDEVSISGVIPSHVRIHFLRNSFLLDNLM